LKTECENRRAKDKTMIVTEVNQIDLTSTMVIDWRMARRRKEKER